MRPNYRKAIRSTWYDNLNIPQRFTLFSLKRNQLGFVSHLRDYIQKIHASQTIPNGT